MVGKSTQHSYRSNSQNSELMCQRAKIIAARLEGGLYPTIKILQMRQLFYPGFDLNVFSVGAEKILQAEQRAEFEYRKSQFSCGLDRLAKFRFDFFCALRLQIGFNESIDATHLRLDPAIGTIGDQRQRCVASMLSLKPI